MKVKNRLGFVAAVALLMLFGMSCTASKSRMGMVQAQDGLMYGSSMDSQFIVDSSLFVNNKIKLRIRNTSGVPSFDLHQFKGQLEESFAALGYIPTSKNDFGILLDINVRYSGQIQENMSDDMKMLGGVAGGVAGAYDPMTKGENREALAGGAVGAVEIGRASCRERG